MLRAHCHKLGCFLVLSRRKAQDHYGLDRRTLEFYEIHVEAEDEHGDNAMKAVEWFAQTAQQQARVRRAFRWSVLAHTAMIEGFDRLLDA